MTKFIRWNSQPLYVWVKKYAKSKFIDLGGRATHYIEQGEGKNEEIYTPDFICHFVGGSEWRGREGVRQQVTRHRTAFPDWNEQIEDIIAGDKVVTPFTSQGTHKGEFQGIPPTGNRITIAEVAIFRIADDKIAEQWGFPDEMALRRQVGAGPKEPDE